MGWKSQGKAEEQATADRTSTCKCAGGGAAGRNVPFAGVRPHCCHIRCIAKALLGVFPRTPSNELPPLGLPLLPLHWQLPAHIGRSEVVEQAKRFARIER